MAEWIKVVILGIVEGVTEFLPISSTGHLIIAEEIFVLPDSLDGTFEIFIQFGAVVAVLFYYREDLMRQARILLQSFTPNKDKIEGVSNTATQKTWQLWLGVLVAFIPAAVIGILLEDWIDRVLFSPVFVAIGLIIGGVMFIIIENTLKSEDENQNSFEATPAGELAVDNTAQQVDTQPLTYRQALIVGLWQCLALIPGMSRSGMSIIGGMLAGLDRSRATQFSFYLALPTLGAATLYKFASDLSQLSGGDITLLLLGAVVSGIVAWLSIDWLLKYVATNNFIPFGYYRIIVGIVILVVLQIV